MESYSLFQLNEYIRRVVALNFREPLWIEAEIAQVKESRGNHYLELVEKKEDGEDIIAQVSAAIWYRKFQFIKKKLGDIIYDLLTDGTQVRIKCTVDFHERYGLKLLIEDVDPNYTFGKLELKRQEIINKLEEEGLMDINKSEIIPSVIQRIAVISSSSAAGYQDFIKQLYENTYGYNFRVDLYDSAVQGSKVEEDTCTAIESIIDSDINYHVVTIIRGGGGKLDLSGYDNYEIAKSIALSQLPFIIGIGHDIDSTVTDMVACLSLKTPTAVADFIVNRNLTFEGRIEQLGVELQRNIIERIRYEESHLSSVREMINLSLNQRMSYEHNRIDRYNDDLGNSIERLFLINNNFLEKMGLIISGNDPKNILEKGYAYITKEGSHIRRKKELEREDEIQLHLQDGKIKGRIL